MDSKALPKLILFKWTVHFLAWTNIFLSVLFFIYCLEIFVTSFFSEIQIHQNFVTKSVFFMIWLVHKKPANTGPQVLPRQTHTNKQTHTRSFVMSTFFKSPLLAAICSQPWRGFPVLSQVNSNQIFFFKLQDLVTLMSRNIHSYNPYPYNPTKHSEKLGTINPKFCEFAWSVNYPLNLKSKHYFPYLLLIKANTTQ